MTAKRNQNHPKKGSSTIVEPIRDLKAIKRIKKALKHKPRDLCLFTLGSNTAFRAGEILSFTVGDVAGLEVGQSLAHKQSKNNKLRRVTVNNAVVATITAWLAVHPDATNPAAPLFISNRGNKPLKTSTVTNMVKGWCRDAGLSGNYGSHSMRKTWGYQQRVQLGTPLPLLMVAFGHSTQQQTLDYLCIQDDEIRDLYGMEL